MLALLTLYTKWNWVKYKVLGMHTTSKVGSWIARREVCLGTSERARRHPVTWGHLWRFWIEQQTIMLGWGYDLEKLVMVPVRVGAQISWHKDCLVKAISHDWSLIGEWYSKSHKILGKFEHFMYLIDSDIFFDCWWLTLILSPPTWRKNATRRVMAMKPEELYLYHYHFESFLYIYLC